MTSRAQLYESILKFLHSRDNFLITTHMNADGDAYASVLAVAFLLNSWGKNFQIVIQDDKKEERYQYLWGWERVISFDEPHRKEYEAGVILDVPSKVRIGKPSELLPAAADCVKIDHHPQEDDLAAINLVDLAASSTSQLVYEVIAKSDLKLNHDLATLLFSGIMYDTGRFSFSNTSRRDFEIAAELLKFNVRPHKIAEQLFFCNSPESMKTIGYGLANMELHLGGKLCIIFVPWEIMRQVAPGESEELANYSVAVRDVEVGLFIREADHNLLKVSLRSRGNVNVNTVARAFGGGGHAHAAGCRITGKFSEFKPAIIREVAKQLD